MDLVLTDEMLAAISRCGGVIYYEDCATCMVKMNGMMIHIKRLSFSDWAVN